MDSQSSPNEEKNTAGDNNDSENDQNEIQDTASASNHTQPHADASARVHPPAGTSNREQVQFNADEDVMPSDDEYSLTVQAAISYANLRNAPIPERTIYDNAERGVIKSWKSNEPGSDTLIGRKSLDRYIQKWLEKKALRVSPQSLADAEHHAELEGQGGKTSSEPEIDTKYVKELETKVKELEDKNLSLHISDTAKDQMLAMVREDQKQLLAAVAEQGKEIGVLETRLQQLEAPKPTDREDQNQQ